MPNADLSNAFRLSWDAEAATATRPMKSASEAAARSFLAPISFERGPLPSQTGLIARWVGGVTLIVLLIACANVANLLLARALRRRREIVLRIALGVSRLRLAFQFITESLLLALAGAGAGLLLAYGTAPVLRRLFLREGAADGSGVDLRTLLFALLITALTGALTSLAPIIQTRRTDLADALKTSARQGGVHRSWLRTALLLAQAALSVLLLVGAALFVRSLRQVESHRLGYDPDQMIYVSLNMRGQQLSAGERETLNQRLVERAQSIAGVERVSLGVTMPFWDNASELVFVDGIDSTSKLGDFTMQSASPGYLATMGTRLLRGRDYTEADIAGGPRVVVVSQRMAEALWPAQDALGKCVRFGSETAPCTTVIGVAENINQRSITEDSGLHYYTPLAQTGLAISARRLSSGSGGIDASVFIRVRGDATEFAESVRRELQPLMPGVAYLLAYPMGEIIDPNLRSWRLGALLFLAFGGVALVLAAVGLYGVIAYDVTQRTQELGVRMALGARPAGVVRLVMRDGVRVAIGGILLGSAIAWFAGPWVEPLLYQQPARDPLVFVMIAAVLLTVAALASMIPAWRAVQVSPSKALQSD